MFRQSREKQKSRELCCETRLQGCVPLTEMKRSTEYTEYKQRHVNVNEAQEHIQMYLKLCPGTKYGNKRIRKIRRYPGQFQQQS